MPLSPTRLRDAIRAKLVARGWANDGDELTEFCADIADAVVAEIVTNAVIVPTLLVAPPGGGPVTGTGGLT